MSRSLGRLCQEAQQINTKSSDGQCKELIQPTTVTLGLCLFCREKFEALQEKESSAAGAGADSRHDDVIHRSSDSAIDSDMSEYHAETLHIDLVLLNDQS